MLTQPSYQSIYFCVRPVDFRKSFNGLCGIVESVFEANVLEGHLFLFVNKRQDRIKAMWFETGGLVIWYKRLEVGTFEVPRAAEGQSYLTIDTTQLSMLLGGVSLAGATRRRRRFAKPGSNVANNHRAVSGSNGTSSSG